MTGGGLAEGLALAEAGTDRVLNAAAQDAWRGDAYAWLSALPHGHYVTSTDLVAAVGMPPSPNAVGAVMRAAAQRGWITATDVYVRSSRPSCHAAVVRVWRGA